jgi:hypothetical protein
VECTVDLKSLPPEHPLRNVPLNTIGVEYRYGGATKWMSGVGLWAAEIAFNELGPAWTESAFNELGPAWTEKNDWRCRPPDSLK